jgi:hypothetical protein
MPFLSIVERMLSPNGSSFTAPSMSLRFQSHRSALELHLRFRRAKRYPQLADASRTIQQEINPSRAGIQIGVDFTMDRIINNDSH